MAGGTKAKCVWACETYVTFIGWKQPIKASDPVKPACAPRCGFGLDRAIRLDERQTKPEIILENTIVPRLDALAEGQKALMETLAPKSRVEALEEEVDLLKTVIRSLSRDVAELKKAQ